MDREILLYRLTSCNLQEEFPLPVTRTEIRIESLVADGAEIYVVSERWILVDIDGGVLPQFRLREACTHAF